MLNDLLQLGQLGFATLAVLTLLVVVLLVAFFGWLLFRTGVKAVNGLTASIDRNTAATQALATTASVQHGEVIAGLTRLEHHFLSDADEREPHANHTLTPTPDPVEVRRPPQHRAPELTEALAGT